MTAQIAGFQTRAQLGLRSPRSRSTSITPQNGGIAVHWGGPKQNLGSHSRCKAIWKSWQNYHMDTHGWVDIAYTAAFCNHGYILAGRGYGTRTAANGTNYGNQNFLAFVWIGGDGDKTTQAAVDALEWLIQDARDNARAGNAVLGHRSFTGSTCPGPYWLAKTRDYHNKPINLKPRDPFEEWWESMNKSQRQVLEQFADEIIAQGRDHGTTGHSIKWLLYDYRQRIEAGLAEQSENPQVNLYEELVRFINATQAMGSRPQGLGEFGIAVIRILRIMGVDLDADMLNAVRDPDNQPTAEQLGLPVIGLDI